MILIYSNAPKGMNSTRTHTHMRTQAHGHAHADTLTHSEDVHFNYFK